MPAEQADNLLYRDENNEVREQAAFLFVQLSGVQEEFLNQYTELLNTHISTISLFPGGIPDSTHRAIEYSLFHTYSKINPSLAMT